MVKLRVRSGESIQEAVRRFRKLCERSGLRKEMPAQGLLREAQRASPPRGAQAPPQGPPGRPRLSQTDPPFRPEDRKARAPLGLFRAPTFVSSLPFGTTEGEDYPIEGIAQVQFGRW